MTKIWIPVVLLLVQTVVGQPNTEVYLFDLDITKGEIALLNPKNVSNNEGYDNQPSFLDDNTLLFSSTRADQTDILKLDILNGSMKSWITDTPTGSEYSPLKIPGRQAVSSIRLDLDGLQRLYEYNLKNGASKVILEDLKVGYHVWYNKNIIVCTVLVDNRMDLVVSDLTTGEVKTVDENVGRSLHKIPYSTKVSYIKNIDGERSIHAFDPLTFEKSKITATYQNTQDICWLEDGTLLAGAGKSLVYANPSKNIDWRPLMYFPEEEIQNISRITTNSSNTRLAFVAEVSPRQIVDKQLEAYNARDIEAFVETYSEEVELYNFPNELTGKGRDDLRKNYKTFFEKTPDLNCEIKNRIIIGNKVIDEEYLTINGQNFSAVAIYEVENGKIAKVTFIQ
jgi:hypothetical protein